MTYINICSDIIIYIHLICMTIFYIYTDKDFCYVYMDIVDGILMILNSCKYYML